MCLTPVSPFVLTVNTSLCLTIQKEHSLPRGEAGRGIPDLRADRESNRDQGEGIVCLGSPDFHLEGALGT